MIGQALFRWCIAVAALLLVYVMFADRHRKANGCVLCCIERLDLPRSTNGLPSQWLANSDTGEVLVRFIVDENGRASRIQATGPTREIENFTRTRLAEGAFKKSCGRGTLELQFIYSALKTPVARDLPAITLEQGGRIRLVFPLEEPSDPLRTVQP
jgi:hypothetical protein